MTAWNVELTRRAIEEVHGRKQLELARPCLRSLSDRQIYARFHYRRADSALKRYIREHLNEKEFFMVALGLDKAEWDRFNIVIRKIAADLTACIQSIHAIPDILASAVYYSLALDGAMLPSKHQFINHTFVTSSVAKLGELKDVELALRSAIEGESYRHLSALANQAKHYSVVFPALSSDLTGERAAQYMLAFPSFTVRGKSFPQVFAREFLPKVYEQLSKAVVNTGHAIDATLRNGRQIR